jgi:hypothetical protein
MRLWTSTMNGASVDARATPVALARATGINSRGAEGVDVKLEVVVVPAAGVDRAELASRGVEVGEVSVVDERHAQVTGA